MNFWDMQKADTQFSLYIRNRDKRCMNPLCICGLNYIGVPIAQLECSHWYGRGVWITRFDPDNCIALGRKCHEMLEHDKQGRYREIMMRILGMRRFSALVRRAEKYIYKNEPATSRSQIIAKCRKLLTGI